ncbi:MAG TPA: exodeoxyribonuclease VII small subunit [Candidatus Limnocylindrales bacterium]|nr:exodeoxyribonuclease VII small subunit [Candidatus Limnocylindrales bacterium]
MAQAIDPAIEKLGFDEALAELQRTVAELEAGGQPLEQALALHERGAALLEHCNRLLTTAELRVKQLVAVAGKGLQAVDVKPEEAQEAPERAEP